MTRTSERLLLVVLIVVMSGVLVMVGHRLWLNIVMGPVTVDHLVPGGTVYHYVGLGNNAHYVAVRVVAADGDRVTVRQYGFFGGSDITVPRAEMLDGHRRNWWTLHAEWGTR